MLSYDEALAVLTGSIRPLGTETVPLASALHRVASRDFAAQENIPSFNNSSMDGFAVRAAEILPGKSLRVQGEIPAGSSAEAVLEPGKVLRIYTGAPLPAGADAILEIELAEDRGDDITPAQSIQPGRSVRKKGEDVVRGEAVIRSGTRLRAVHLGVLASLGITDVEVYRVPRVAVLTTGDELLPISAKLTPGKIRNSNQTALAGLISDAHCESIDLGVAADNEHEIRSRVENGLRFDALATSGGISVGKYDLVLGIAESLGVKTLIRTVNIKPGMPFTFGMYEHRVPVFLLPGNPVPTSVTFLQLARPGLSHLSGELVRPLPRLTAALEHPITKNDGKRHFSRGVVRSEAGQLIVRTTRTQSSGALSSLVEANCLVILPETARSLAAGESVEVELL